MKESNLIMCEYNKGLLDGLSEAILEFTKFNEKGFHYLDTSFNKYGLEIKLEYLGDDIEYKTEDDFNNDLTAYKDFTYRMGDIVISKGLKLKNEIIQIIKKYSLSIKLSEFEWDEYDYPCIYLFFESKTK